MGERIIVPPSFVKARANWAGDTAAAEADALATLGESYLERWELTPDGAAMHGVASLVQPVRRADGTPAVLKVPIIDVEQPGEAAALRAWAGDGAVRLYAEDPDTWVLLLERLEPRDLENFKDDLSAVRIVCALLRRLHAHAAPAGIPRLVDVAAKMIVDAPTAATKFSDPAHRRLAALLGRRHGRGCRRGRRSAAALGSALRERAGRRARAVAGHRPEAASR